MKYNNFMLFSEFANTLEKLENTSKRLEITQILTDLISQFNSEEIRQGTYMSLGLLDASYKSPKFNLADKMIVRALSFTYDKEIDSVQTLYSKLGDLGLVGEELSTKQKDDITLLQVHELLTEIANIEGSGSQELKIKKVAELIKDLDKKSTKYIIRIILGTTRLGFTELTVIDALSKLIGASKEQKEEIENRYNSYPDIGVIAQTIKTSGLEGLYKIKMEVGVPILPQRCQRISTITEIIEKMGDVWAEFKFDGTRVQLHIDRNKKEVRSAGNQSELFALSDESIFIRTFTRNLEDSTHQYPDINQAADQQLDADSVILDGEAIAYDPVTKEFLPFQEVMQRKRKHNVLELAQSVPLKYFVFDILFCNGEDLTLKPLIQRHEIMKKVIKPGQVIEIAKHVETDTAEELVEFFEESKDKNLEGMILKKPSAPYQAGARSFAWVKFKKADEKLLDDSVDTVVLGYYFGKGMRAQFGIGGFLVGVMDKESDTIKTVTKVGTGLSDEDWVLLKSMCDKNQVKEKPKNYDVPKVYNPDVWVKPQIVVELGADEISKSKSHSAGYALRFPRLIKFRDDKSYTDTTNTTEIEQLYKNQKRGYY